MYILALFHLSKKKKFLIFGRAICIWINIKYFLVLWKVIVFAYWRHKVSSLDQLLVMGLLYTNTQVCTSCFIFQTQESFISYTFTSAAIFQGFHHEPSFPFRTPHDASALHTLSEWWKNSVFHRRGQKGLPCALSLCGPWSFVSLDVSSLSDPCCYSIWHRSITWRDPVQTAALPDANNQGHAESKNTWACYLLTSASSIALGLSDWDHPQSLDF